MNRTLTNLVGAVPVFCMLVFFLAVAQADQEKDQKKSSPAAEKKTEAKEEKKEQAEKKEKKKEESAKKKGEAKPEEKPAEEEKPEEKKKEEKKYPEAKTVKLKHQPLKLTVDLEGVFVAKEMAEIELDSEQLSSFEVVEAVEHGQEVRKGQELVVFKREDYEEQLEKKERAMRLAEISLRETELEVEALQASFPIAEEALQVEKRRSDEDFAYYFKVEQEWDRKMAEMSLRSSEFSVENQREEVEQLEKMYGADDLTEETEEIVLRRARFQLEMAEMSFAQAKLRFERTMETLLPRMEEDIKRSAKLEEIRFRSSEEAMPLELEQAELALEQERIALEEQREALEEFMEDEKWLTIKSPASGVVYLGECQDGAFSGGATLAENLKEGEKVSNGTVLMTIVQLRPMQVQTKVPEKELHWVKKGTAGEAKPVAYPDMALSTKVTWINRIPSVDGDFAAELNVELPKEAEPLVPGMKTKVELVVYDKKKAVLVPKTAVGEEEDDETFYVQQVVEDGNALKKRVVTKGKEKGEMIEIVKGLEPGMRILKAVAEAEKKDE
jgi:multidrug efflux pump subunit AcrA (membrane-fusion protein)